MDEDEEAEQYSVRTVGIDVVGVSDTSFMGFFARPS
jgi:hypothetical protein